MPIYTFSARATKPNDIATVERAKEHCAALGICFSHHIIKLLREHEDAARKVRDSKQTSE